jgi:hypothetical protein
MSDTFSAPDSMLGYLYQSRVALRLALERLSELGLNVKVEGLDDITVISRDDKSLIQTKLRSRICSLSDASSEIWKTLRIWSDFIYVDGNPPNQFTKILFTGAVAKSNSAASFLLSVNRKEEQARRILTKIAKNSENKTNKEAYKSYLRLSEVQKLELLQSIKIVDSEQSNSGVRKDIENRLLVSTERTSLSAFADELEGWWLNKIILQLEKRLDCISGAELEAQVQFLSDKYGRANLPLVAIAKTDVERYRSRQFVRQLNFFRAGVERVSQAVDYYEQANTHRLKWLRDLKITKGELDKYDLELRTEWKIYFNRAKSKAIENDLKTEEEAAEATYQWAETVQDIVLSRCRERFLCRGSLHILADSTDINSRIGWHPRYDELLKNDGT